MKFLIRLSMIFDLLLVRRIFLTHHSNPFCKDYASVTGDKNCLLFIIVVFKLALIFCQALHYIYIYLQRATAQRNVCLLSHMLA